VSGTIDELCPTLGLVEECVVSVGDRVIVYPANEEEFTETGSVQEYIVRPVTIHFTIIWSCLHSLSLSLSLSLRKWL